MRETRIPAGCVQEFSLFYHSTCGKARTYYKYSIISKCTSGADRVRSGPAENGRQGDLQRAKEYVIISEVYDITRGGYGRISLAVSFTAKNRAGRIGNRVETTNGTAAVYTNERIKTKVSHWGNSRRRSVRREHCSGMCESEDLLQERYAANAGGVSSRYGKNGCGDGTLCHRHSFLRVPQFFT